MVRSSVLLQANRDSTKLFLDPQEYFDLQEVQVHDLVNFKSVWNPEQGGFLTIGGHGSQTITNAGFCI
ncbi:Putative transposable element [Caligus rogercresseyi]|uniref:Transposable element n=1 Tax=Caligus rogercresseyi TaxID=217165 RepID=A0A7T8JVF5_CALRO|nr:Putative transposable element [Caligus rogercresseyi]